MQLTLDPSAEQLTCRLTPSGRLEVFGGAERIVAAFAVGRGEGLLHLALKEHSAELPPSLVFWRSVGQAYLARVCSAIQPDDPYTAILPDLPLSELEALLEAVPPGPGIEFLTPELLKGCLHDMGSALAAATNADPDGLQGILSRHGSVWNVVGRVCLHLAENKRDPELPFAFLATYVHGVSKQARPQHLPLGRALQEYAGAGNRAALLALLAPLSRAAEQSAFLKDLMDSGAVYRPLSWSPSHAYRFLSEVAHYERAGLVVRTPDWWSAANRPRPSVTVSVGGQPPSTLGLDALLDFDVSVTLQGEALSRAEIEELLSRGEGLALIKGRWVEVDRDKLSEVLAHWRHLEGLALEGIGFGDGMRLLAGARLEGRAEDAEAERNYTRVVAGDWLAAQMESLRRPGQIPANAGLTAELRPYQRVGVQWLSTLRVLRLGGCLADDMGLGKTIQVLGMLSLAGDGGTDLLVVPASLLDNWRQEAARFAPHLRVLTAHASANRLAAANVEDYHVVLTTYGTLTRTDWMRDRSWRHVILDEAQAIKNPGSRQTKAVKALRARWRLALTGTPIENRLGDLWSLFDFLSPGLLGSPQQFNRLCKAMASENSGFAPLRRLVQPYVLRRLKTDKSIIADLPDKVEVNAYCLLTKRQAALYAQSVEELAKTLERFEGIERRGVVLKYLLRLKQICNHPSHWLGDGVYHSDDSGKLVRLRELCEPIAERQEKVLVFTQFREMTEPLAAFLSDVFGRPGLVLHGGTPVAKRQGLVTRFQEDESVPFMVLSLKAGGTGLNLTGASHVVHFDRWWNPAVESQATDRAFRIGQKRNVLVHKFVCRGTVEERIDSLLSSKRKISDEVLAAGSETALTEMSNEELLAMVALDLSSALEG